MPAWAARSDDLAGLVDGDSPRIQDPAGVGWNEVVEVGRVQNGPAATNDGGGPADHLAGVVDAHGVAFVGNDASEVGPVKIGHRAVLPEEGMREVTTEA